MDLVLKKEIDAGISQIVILGAGYDTRAYRFASLLHDATVYEVDMPAIQERKQKLISKHAGTPPPSLRYVSVRRDHRDLFEELSASEYDPTQRTLFVWSGVVMYLQPSAFAETLTAIRKHTAVNSTLIFDYFSSGVVAGVSEEHGARQVYRRVSKLGEPLSFGADPEEMADLLKRHGFELVSNLGPDDLSERYLRTSDGDTAGRPFGFAFIAEARSLEFGSENDADVKATDSVQ